MGFPGYFLVVADFINWAKDNGIRVGPGPWLGRRLDVRLRDADHRPRPAGARPDLRALPQPRPRLDARLRRRLRRASARRGHPVRHREVRRRPRRRDRHLRHASRPSRRSRTPRACSATRSRWASGSPRRCRRPSWARTSPLKAIFDPSARALQRGRRVPRRCTTATPTSRTVVDTAIGLEGLKRQWGVHAAGVIMSSEPLIDIIPIMKRRQDGAIITQFDYPTCETLGLIKMDFLGLRNLTVLDDALDNIEANRGEKVVLEELELDDPATYDLLARGDTLGVFQLDGGPMRALLRSMQPDNFEDISAVVALYRPGPDGRRLAQQVRPPQERPRAGRADPPRARRGARGRPRRDLRPDRLPGAGDGDRPEAGRLLARPGRPAAPRDGQEEEGGARQAVRDLLRRHDRARLLHRRDQDAVGHPAARSPTTPSTRRTPRRTASSPTGRPTSRPTTRPSTWPRC